jgi:hypothetical protein
MPTSSLIKQIQDILIKKNKKKSNSQKWSYFTASQNSHHRVKKMVNRINKKNTIKKNSLSWHTAKSNSTKSAKKVHNKK